MQSNWIKWFCFDLLSQKAINPRHLSLACLLPQTVIHFQLRRLCWRIMINSLFNYATCAMEMFCTTFNLSGLLQNDNLNWTFRSELLHLNWFVYNLWIMISVFSFSSSVRRTSAHFSGKKKTLNIDRLAITFTFTVGLVRFAYYMRKNSFISQTKRGEKWQLIGDFPKRLSDVLFMPPHQSDYIKFHDITAIGGSLTARCFVPFFSFHIAWN